MKKMNKKGFTLAELLIVVAIIAVLVAIAIPVFSSQLDKSKDATNIANARSIYAVLVTDFLEDGSVDTAPSGTFNGSADATITVGTQTFGFKKLNNAAFSYGTNASTGAPMITYTDRLGSTTTFRD